MKRRAVGLLTSAVLVLCLAPATKTALAGDHDGSRDGVERLTSRIDYWYVGHLGQFDDEGRKLVWEGTIAGDLEGTMKWWFGPAPAPKTVYAGGLVNYYAGRWEIWDGDKLLLAGESAGKTVIPEGEDGMWDGHGVVTQACRRLRHLKGRPIYETGPVIWPSPMTGTGIFSIY